MCEPPYVDATCWQRCWGNQPACSYLVQRTLPFLPVHFCRFVLWLSSHQFVSKQVEEIPENFPFKISDEKGTNAVTLKRTYQGEQIEVVVHMPSLVTGDEPDHDRDGEDEDTAGDDNDEDEGQKPEQSSIPLTVTISKGDGPVLEFTCTAYPDEVIIDSMSVTQQSGDDERDMIAYEGPDFKYEGITILTFFLVF